MEYVEVPQGYEHQLMLLTTCCGGPCLHCLSQRSDQTHTSISEGAPPTNTMLVVQTPIPNCLTKNGAKIANFYIT